MTARQERGRGAIDAALRSYLEFSKRIVLVASIAMLMLMVALNGLEIVGRGAFGRSFTWVQEVSIIAAMWVYFFAYGLIAKDDEYIRVDIVANLLGPGARHALGIVARLTTVAFHATVLWFAFETWQFLGLFRTSVLDWPESLFVLPIMLGAGDILATELIYLYWSLVGRLPPPRPHAPVEEV
ncbi:MAG: TRAP transporter small permease subunit [Alphaproteobacteria bacterium]|nr:TRAP transporter small permease subunit [Alphaproteobacteria bacterium]